MKRQIGTVVCCGAAVLAVACGCGSNGLFSGMAGSSSEPTGLAADVATKAAEVGQQIGGEDGFGGAQIAGYRDHMPEHMGFHGMGYLAEAGDTMTVELENGADLPCTFEIVFVASQGGTDDQTTTVTVEPGEVQTIEMPCAEIIGLGSLTVVGDPAVQLDDGTELDNVMCVPGFLGADFLCGDTYHCFVEPDADDVDGDGDTEELIVTTDGLRLHLGPSGLNGHGHGMGGGMGMMKGR